MSEGVDASTPACAISRSSASVPVCGWRRRMSSRKWSYGARPGRSRTNASIRARSIFRISGSTKAASAANAAARRVISCVIACPFDSRVSSSESWLA